ncbi:hypothetical protein BHM03_00059141 [Ensete ventricosum]|nr:hypothetical protein BHM03_00059141 [Ensete ventricosum]
MKAKRFERGLRPGIRSQISALKLFSYADVVESALIIERDLEEIQEIVGKNYKDKFTNKSKRVNEYENSNKRVKMSGLEKGKPPQRTQTCVKCGYNHETSKCFRVTGTCFACGKLDHKVKDCPLNKKKEPLPPKTIAHTRVYAITEQDSRASKSVVEGIIRVSNKNANILFDPRSNLSFVSQNFACHSGIQLKPLDYELYVTIVVGDTLTSNLFSPSCLIFIGEHELLADLIFLEIQGFDIILGIDWLSSYHASIDCYKKIITFCIPDQPIFYFKGIRHDLLPCLISTFQAH